MIYSPFCILMRKQTFLFSLVTYISCGYWNCCFLESVRNEHKQSQKRSSLIMKTMNKDFSNVNMADYNANEIRYRHNIRKYEYCMYYTPICNYRLAITRLADIKSELSIEI